NRRSPEVVKMTNTYLDTDTVTPGEKRGPVSQCPTGPAIAQADSSDSVIPAGRPDDGQPGSIGLDGGAVVTGVLSDGGFETLKMSSSGSALASRAVGDWICELPLLPLRKRLSISAGIEV